MNKKNLIILLYAFLITVFIYPCRNNLQAQEFYDVIMEKQMEERLKEKVMVLLKTKDIIVNIKIKFAWEEIALKKTDKEIKHVLPAVPVREELIKKEKDFKEYRKKIDNILVTFLIGKEISSEEKDRISKFATILLNIDKKRGDIVSILSYKPPGNFLQHLEAEKLIAIPLFLLAIILFVFFSGLLKHFKNFNEHLSQKMPSHEAEVQSALPRERERNVSSEVISASIGSKEERPFSFINSNNIEDLSSILADKNDEELAIIFYALPEELSAHLFSKLPIEKRESITLLSNKITKPKEGLEELEREIDYKLKYIYGGVEKFSKIIQLTDKSTRESVMNFLEEKNKYFVEELKKHIFEIEDLVDYDDEIFRKIFREIGVEHFAPLINSFPEELSKKFNDKLTPVMRNLLSEQVKVAPVYTEEQKETERLRIINIMAGLSDTMG